MAVLGALKLVFHDKRFTLVVLVAWMSAACGIFYHLGAFDGKFMTVGPSEVPPRPAPQHARGWDEGAA